jgi:hypothetical protein
MHTQSWHLHVASFAAFVSDIYEENVKKLAFKPFLLGLFILVSKRIGNRKPDPRRGMVNRENPPLPQTATQSRRQR